MRRAFAVTIFAGILALGAGCFSLEKDPNELRLGAPLPAVVLRTPKREPFPLARVAERGLPVVLFYRGHW